MFSGLFVSGTGPTRKFKFPYLQIKLFSEPGIDGKLDSIFKVKQNEKDDYHHHFFLNSNIFQTISSFVIQHVLWFRCHNLIIREY